ncbi:MAG TPA: class I SAM-dependent methyltransferase [Pyrinomonadaceae bacterium]|jgi:ubiquinone/menaquinone biosynthesis C-methylase UbiE|nr:class I SAM-dependent methyltransferase [Pyrinomonadaceae bacterium]
MENLAQVETMTLKTNKELAFLHELFVATDWGERFAELIDNHLKLPKEGRALYVASGTGGHVIALQERANKNLAFLGVDESEENLVLAREKAKTVLKDGFEFRVERVDSLRLPNAQFNLVIGDGSLVHSERIPEMLFELVRVAAPKAKVALVLPSFSSFGEFFSIYWEALHNLGLMDHERDVESLISVLPSVSQLEELAEQAGLENVNSTTQIEELDYASADAFLAAPLVADFLMPIWLETLPPDSHQQVIDEIARIVNGESQGVTFALTVKATLLTGEKSLAH